MDKTLQKVTKDPSRVEAACKGREKYMNKLKGNILSDAKKGSGYTTNASNQTTSATNTATTPATTTNTTTTTRSSDTIWRWYTCCPCHWCLCNFLHITLSSLKIKNSSMKNRINHQSDFMSLKDLYNKWVTVIVRKTNLLVMKYP